MEGRGAEVPGTGRGSCRLDLRVPAVRTDDVTRGDDDERVPDAGAVMYNDC